MHAFIQRCPRTSLALSAILAISIAVSGTIVVWQRARVQHVAAVEMSAYTLQPDDLTRIAQHSALVVEGTIEQVYPSRWTTVDGHAPQDMQAVLNSPDVDMQLRTPVQLNIERVYKGQHASKQILFTFPGGSDRTTGALYEADDSHGTAQPGVRTLQAGKKAIVFLSRAPENAGAWSKISPFYPELYLTVDGETLHGPLKDLSRSTFRQQFGAGQH